MNLLIDGAIVILLTVILIKVNYLISLKEPDRDLIDEMYDQVQSMKDQVSKIV